jgi:hypothetical protein
MLSRSLFHQHPLALDTLAHLPTADLLRFLYRSQPLGQIPMPLSKHSSRRVLNFRRSARQSVHLAAFLGSRADRASMGLVDIADLPSAVSMEQQAHGGQAATTPKRAKTLFKIYLFPSHIGHFVYIAYSIIFSRHSKYLDIYFLSI